MKTEELVKVTKDYYCEVLSTGLKEALGISLPFFKVPPLSTIASLVINKVVSISADILERGAFFTYTDLRLSKQGKEYVNAKLYGYSIEKTGTPEEKKLAEEQIKKTFRLVGRFTA